MGKAAFSSCAPIGLALKRFWIDIHEMQSTHPRGMSIFCYFFDTLPVENASLPVLAIISNIDGMFLVSPAVRSSSVMMSPLIISVITHSRCIVPIVPRALSASKFFQFTAFLMAQFLKKSTNSNKLAIAMFIIVLFDILCIER